MDQMVNTQKKKTTNKNSFLSSAGQIDIDENALTDLREASVTQGTVEVDLGLDGDSSRRIVGKLETC